MQQVLLFLFANNFLGLANYCIPLLFIYILWKRKLKFVCVNSVIFGTLIAASISFMIIDIMNYGSPEIATMVMRYINPIILFYLGYVITYGDDEKLKNSIIIISFGMFLHGFMNLLANRNINVLLIAGRQYKDIYGGVISATLQNLNYIMAVALFFYFVVYERKKFLKIIGIFATVGGVIGSILNASRTVLYVTPIIFLLALLLHMLINKSFTLGIMKWIGTVIVLFSIILLIMWFDIFNIQEWFATTALGQRSSISENKNTISGNNRWVYAIDILKLLPLYPLGKSPYKNYAHNLWLDVAKDAGVIPFVLYILFTIGIIFLLIKFYREKTISKENKIGIISVVVAFLIVFFTEPILEGAPIFFGIFAYIIGGIQSIIMRKKRHLVLKL
ncbi:hypothetical protein ACV3ON_10545 [Clostridium perfringens]|nr:hypothetical protein [Clostridium perfringens]